MISLRQRLSAGGIHLLISVMVGLAACALVFFVWYPAPLAILQGVGPLVLLLIGVDVIIGPLITTLVFDRRKKSLRFDLAVIALLQVAALVYGMSSIFQGRPAYVVFNVDRFDVVAAVDVDRASLERSGRRLPLLGPQWVAARLPTDPDQRTALLFSAVGGGADLPQLPEHFVELPAEREAMLAKLKPLSDLADIPLPDAAIHGYLPMRGRSGDGSVILERHSGAVVRAIDAPPRW